MTYLVSILTFGAIWAIAVVSLNILVGYGGQVSLGHAAFLGIGAYTAAIAATRYDVPFLLAVVAAVAVTAAVAGLLGLPSLRVRHDFLVLATIGLNFIVAGVFGYVEFFGGALGIVGIPPPAVGSFRLDGPVFLAVCLVTLAAVAWMSWALTRTWGGMALFALREDELAAASLGVGHARYKISAFVISGAVAGLAGALYAPFVGNIFPGRFGFIESIILMSMLVFGGIGTVRGAVVGGFVLKALPEYLRFGGDLRFALYGAILLAVIVLQPQGLLGNDSFLWRRIVRLRDRFRAPTPARQTTVREPRHTPKRAGVEPVLSVEAITVDFDGLRAVDDVSLEVRRGEILGLIGPNGAGKTTLFNAIAGTVPSTVGSVRIRGQEVQGRRSHRIARYGLARTFQIVRPFRDLDTQHNVLSGLGARSYGHASAFLRRFASDEGDARQIVGWVGLGRWATTGAAQLPIGLLRRLEVGRALALAPDVVLLDEPVAGLTSDEVTELEEVIRDVAAEGRAVVLIEHNMSFAMRICDRIVVLAGGAVLAEGDPQQISDDPQVIEAYLGAAP